MKSKMLKVLAAALLISFSFSCKKSNEPTTQSVKVQSLFEILEGKNVKTNGNIVLTASSYSFSNPMLGQMDVDGWFKDKDGVATKADKLLIGGQNIAEQSNFRYVGHFSSSTNKTDINQIAESLFGNDVSITLNNPQFGNVEASLYSPSTLRMDVSDAKNNVLLKSKGFTVKWNPDNKDKVLLRNGAEPLVAAMIVYHSGFSSNQSQQVLPSENVTAFKVANDATGEVTFSPQELAALPTNGYVIVYTGRANQVIVPSSNGQTLGITALALSSSQEIRIGN